LGALARHGIGKHLLRDCGMPGASRAAKLPLLVLIFGVNVSETLQPGGKSMWPANYLLRASPPIFLAVNVMVKTRHACRPARRLSTLLRHSISLGVGSHCAQ